MNEEPLKIKIHRNPKMIQVLSEEDNLKKMLREGKITPKAYDENLAAIIDRDIAKYFKEDSVSEKSKRSSNQSGDSLKKLKKGGNDDNDFEEFISALGEKAKKEEERKQQEEQLREQNLKLWQEMQREEEEAERIAKEAERIAKARILPQGGKKMSKKRGGGGSMSLPSTTAEYDPYIEVLDETGNPVLCPICHQGFEYGKPNIVMCGGNNGILDKKGCQKYFHIECWERMVSITGKNTCPNCIRKDPDLEIKELSDDIIPDPILVSIEKPQFNWPHSRVWAHADLTDIHPNTGLSRRGGKTKKKRKSIKKKKDKRKKKKSYKKK